MTASPGLPIFRFAPSPNGSLHLGHAYSAILNHGMARAAGGHFLLRLEDIDLERCRPQHVASIIDDLTFLGLRWDELPRRQSEHMSSYAAALKGLEARGLVYPAFLTRGEVRAHVLGEEARTGEPWPRDPDGAPHYPGLDRLLPAGERQARIEAGRPFAWRLDMARALKEAGALDFRERRPDGATLTMPTDPAAWGDVVLGRRDVPTSYHLAVVLDDAAQGVSHVVRGADLFAATDVHRLLQALLGLPAPVYTHHRLILGPDGTKLSKSRDAPSLGDLRRAGRSRAGIFAMLGLSEDGQPRGGSGAGLHLSRG